jgi:hypothetical protein
MKRRSSVSFVVIAIALASAAACEKTHDAQGSGALDASDKALFQYLPAGQALFWGGNYMKLQNFMQSTMGQMTSAMMDKMGSGMSQWMTCFADAKQLRVAASVGFEGNGAAMRMVTSGMTLDEVVKCGQQAGFATNVDPDHKFASVVLPPPAPSAGYLVLPSGALYTRQAFALALTPTMVSATRAELEADQAKVGANNAVTDPTLTRLVGKVDRSKTAWVVGSAANTPVAAKLGDAWATIDISSGLAMELTLQVKNQADIDKIDQGITQLRGMADQVPASFQDLIKNLKFDHQGDHVHFAIKVNEDSLKSIMSQVGGMIGANMAAGAH